MNIILVGTNHKYSPIAIREELFFSRMKNIESLVSLTSQEGIKGGVILSTCNRVELYASTESIEAGIKILKNFLSGQHNQKLEDIEPYLYTYIGKRAIGHLFEVTSGLDSQIIGESQILEQVRTAWQEAKKLEATDRLLDNIFSQAIKTSLEVRQETRIGVGNISLASIALELIKTNFSQLKDKKILIIGVGKISELVIRSLKEAGANTVFIANKTFEKAKRLSKGIGASVVKFDRLKEKLKDTDVVISATSSPHLILRKEDLSLIEKPLLIIDLAMPRDVDPAVKQIKGVTLFDLDDMDFIIEKNLEQRKKEISRVLEIIRKEAQNLCLRESLESEPAEALLP